MKGGIVRDYPASSKGLKWLGANVKGILVVWIMTSYRCLNNYQSLGKSLAFIFRVQVVQEEDKMVVVFVILMDIRVL